MPSWGDLLGKGSVVEQLAVWGVLNQLISELLGPAFDLIGQDVNAAFPVSVLSPEMLADAVVRGIKEAPAAAAEAQRSGIDGDRFSEMVAGAGEPPGLETVLEMWRRGFIPWADAGPESASVERAIKTSRVYDYWSDAIAASAEVPMSVGEAVNALLRGQTDRATAEAEAKANGINSDRFNILLDSAGRPPTPMELVTLLRRGLIPREGVGPGVVSFQQGIFEGDAKDKWWGLYAHLADYVPPPRTVTALLRTGSISVEQALGYLADAGLSAELAAAYVHSAQGEKMAGTRRMAEQTVLAMLETRALTEPEAAAHLAALGYDPADVALMVQTIDLQREYRALNSAVTRVGTLYVGHKITRQAAGEALAALDVGAGHRDHLLATWDTERAATVRLLTPPQILKAYKLGNLSESDTRAELQALGYTARDAQLLIWNETGATAQALPAQGPTGPGTVP